MIAEAPVYTGISGQEGLTNRADITQTIEKIRQQHARILEEFPEGSGLATEIAIFDVHAAPGDLPRDSEVEIAGGAIRDMVKAYSERRTKNGNWDNTVVQIRLADTIERSFDAHTVTGDIYYYGAPRPALASHAVTRWFKHGLEIVGRMRTLA